MSNLSEEEIRKILLCENIGELAYCGLLDKLDESNNMDLNELKKQAIQGLLDLYNKEKEKNKEIEKLLEEKTIRVGFTNEDNFISKDKIKELKQHYIDDCENRNLTLIPLENLIKNINILLEAKD